MYKMLLISSFVLVFIGQSFAGLHIDGEYDATVAVYHFEDGTDSGPRGYHLGFGGDGTEFTSKIIDDGKFNKALELTGEFGCICGFYEDESLAIVGAEFSIVAWVRLPKQQNQFFMAMEAWGNDDTDEMTGSVSLTVNSDGNLIGSLRRGITNAHIGTTAWDNTERDVADSKWHHIAFTQYGNYLNLFVDGRLAKRVKFDGYLGFLGDSTLIRIGVHHAIDSEIRLDDLGFFETGFSQYEIYGLANTKFGLKGFLRVMAVDPGNKVATTWGKLKLR